MPRWSGKTRGGIAGYKIFVFFIRYFGIGFAYFFLNFVVLYFLFFAPAAVRSLYYYFHESLKYTTLKAFVHIYRNFYRLGQTLIDKVAFLSGFDSRFTFDFDGEHHLVKMAEETGGILVGAHTGNWEIAGQLLKRIKTRINIVMFRDEHEKIQQYLSDIYVEKNVHFIIINVDYSHLFQIEEALKNKEIVAMHGDRYLPGTNTLEVNLLGKPAKFPTGPFSLAYRYKVPLTFVSAMKQTARHYYFYASEPVIHNYPAKLSERRKIISGLVEDYVRHLEKMVLRFPDQWFNFYDFWETEKQLNQD
jgi:predicted LPLAT superfamily acyltransferase